jgi:hypothetical protein
MIIPNAGRATIDPAKIRDYLLSDIHPVGRFKAAFFTGLGYSSDQWERLRDDLLTLARTGRATLGKPSPFGQTFELDGMLTGPHGRSAEVRTVWIIRASEDVPRSGPYRRSNALHAARSPRRARQARRAMS